MRLEGVNKWIIWKGDITGPMSEPVLFLEVFTGHEKEFFEREEYWFNKYPDETIGGRPIYQDERGKNFGQDYVDRTHEWLSDDFDPDYENFFKDDVKEDDEKEI